MAGCIGGQGVGRKTGFVPFLCFLEKRDRAFDSLESMLYFLWFFWDFLFSFWKYGVFLWIFTFFFDFFPGMAKKESLSFIVRENVWIMLGVL